MGLSTADGSVRTQTSVRMSLSPVPGSDFVMAMSAPVQARMGDIRTCFAEAMASNPRAEGRVVLQVDAASRGRAKAQITLNETGDPKLAECMRRALAQTDLHALKSTRASIVVALDLTNPTARMRESMEKRRAVAQTVPVKTLGGGRVYSEGGTYAREVRFELTTSAFARPALERLHRDLNARLAGLLDCRRRATQRGMTGVGAIELGLTFNRGHARARTVRSELADRTAPQCVSTWIDKSATRGAGAEGPTEIALTVHFAR